MKTVISIVILLALFVVTPASAMADGTECPLVVTHRDAYSMLKYTLSRCGNLRAPVMMAARHDLPIHHEAEAMSQPPVWQITLPVVVGTKKWRYEHARFFPAGTGSVGSDEVVYLVAYQYKADSTRKKLVTYRVASADGELRSIDLYDSFVH